MPTTALPTESFKFITFRSGGQRFALDAKSVVGTFKASTVGPKSSETPEGACGTLKTKDQELPVFDLAEWLGIEGRSDTASAPFLIVNSVAGRIALQVGEISGTQVSSAGNVVPLPPPLDRLVSDRYLGILKVLPVGLHTPGDASNAPALGWKAKRDIQHHELLLLLDPEQFLRTAKVEVILADPLESADLPEGSASPKPEPVLSKPQASAVKPRAVKPQLVLFSPTPVYPGDRPCLFGVSAAQVMEICRPLSVVKVPGAAEEVVGIVQWRNAIVPVLRMAEMVGLEGIAENRVQRILIALVPGGQHLVAIQILAAMRTQELPVKNTPQPLLDDVAARYLYGSYELEHETLVMPNLNSMLQLV